jgi:hypothetical protein
MNQRFMMVLPTVPLVLTRIFPLKLIYSARLELVLAKRLAPLKSRTAIGLVACTEPTAPQAAVLKSFKFFRTQKSGVQPHLDRFKRK